MFGISMEGAAYLSLGDIGAGVASGLILIPYVLWGTYTLRVRYRYREDIAPRVEAATLLGVMAILAVETTLLRSFIEDKVYFLFAALGLLVSAAALYGPTLNSLISHVLVDIIVPGDRSRTREPYYGPAESLERQGDFAGAIREYTVVARLFPNEPKPLLRIAEAYVRLAEPANAAMWFEKTLPSLDSVEEHLQVTNRLCEIYRRDLDCREDAVRLLYEHLARFPDSEFADSVRRRIENLRTAS